MGYHIAIPDEPATRQMSPTASTLDCGCKKRRIYEASKHLDTPLLQRRRDFGGKSPEPLLAAAENQNRTERTNSARGKSENIDVHRSTVRKKPAESALSGEATSGPSLFAAAMPDSHDRPISLEATPGLAMPSKGKPNPSPTSQSN
jgi:hypothetical protein